MPEAWSYICYCKDCYNGGMGTRVFPTPPEGEKYADNKSCPNCSWAKLHEYCPHYSWGATGRPLRPGVTWTAPEPGVNAAILPRVGTDLAPTAMQKADTPQDGSEGSLARGIDQSDAIDPVRKNS